MVYESGGAATPSLDRRDERVGAGRAARRLLVIERDGPSYFCLPASGQILIGRAESSHLRLRDPTASRHHARLDLQGDDVVIMDVDSHNGTRVNGERLRSPRPLRPGDMVFICNAVLIYEAGAATSPRSPAQDGSVLQIGERAVIAADPAMVRLFTLLRRLADSDLPVLITGETGAGKEVAAQAVHAWSWRQSGPLVALNCAALPESLIESELFGYQKGAFSGAVAMKPGLLESAHQGVVLLDEVGELPLAAQAKLLRALETRRVTRLGELRERAFDARIVAATNRNLEEEVQAGRFRRDLFYRLSAVSVYVPALRERPRDLPLLARAFLDAACAQARRPPMELSPAALELLRSYGWPGNIRELKFVLEYIAAAVEERVVLPCHLPERVRRGGPALEAAQPSAVESASPAAFRPLQEELRELERSRIRSALKATGGVQTRAARLLAMPLRTFIQRMNLYGLHRSGRGKR